jgi:hypothetical protein
MCPFAQPCFNGIDLLHQLLDHGQYWVANQFGLLTEFIPIDVLNPAMPYDLVGGLLRNDLEAALSEVDRMLPKMRESETAVILEEKLEGRNKVTHCQGQLQRP